MKKRNMLLSLISAVMLTGCVADGQVSQTNEKAVISDTEGQMLAETTKASIQAVHDYDIEAMKHAAESVAYFQSDECQELTFYPDEEAVKRYGRFIEYKDCYYLSYTCSAVSFIMTGDRAEAVINSNASVYPDHQQCYIGVVIDGVLTERIRLAAGENTYTLYEGDMLTNANIMIVKLTENQMATAGISSITVNASRIAPEPDRSLDIEFIGDSITCGYGNEASSPSDGYNSSQQNGLKTYGYYCARELDADWSMVSISGLGLISDYTDTVGEKEDYLLMPDVYDYSDVNFQMRRGIEDLTNWDFGEGSDIIVINMGTNDYSYTGKREELQDEFYEAYYNFIGQVRKKNPNADIICTMGIMGSELFEDIEEAAQGYAADNSDDRIYTFKFDYQSEEDGYGGDYHPTDATHKKAAEKLAEFIKTLL